MNILGFPQWEIDLGREEHEECSINVNMDESAWVEFLKTVFSALTRTGWILPKRLRSKFGVSVVKIRIR